MLSLITFSASKLSFSFVSRITKERFIISSIVFGLAREIRIFSVSVDDSLPVSESSMATFPAARSVIRELTMQVTSINRTVPFNTSSFSRRSPPGRIMLYPTSTAASVAAACALLKPYIRFRSRTDILYIFCVSQQAIHLPVSAITIITAATFSASPCPKMTRRLINIPTPIRK